MAPGLTFEKCYQDDTSSQVKASFALMNGTFSDIYACVTACVVKVPFHYWFGINNGYVILRCIVSDDLIVLTSDK
jgi:hypothetical protein